MARPLAAREVGFERRKDGRKARNTIRGPGERDQEYRINMRQDESGEGLQLQISTLSHQRMG